MYLSVRIFNFFFFFFLHCLHAIIFIFQGKLVQKDIFVFSNMSVFAVYYCYDGLLRERPFEVIGFAITVFILTLYVLINYLLEGEQDDITKLVRWVWLRLSGGRVSTYFSSVLLNNGINVTSTQCG